MCMVPDAEWVNYQNKYDARLVITTWEYRQTLARVSMSKISSSNGAVTHEFYVTVGGRTTHIPQSECPSMNAAKHIAEMLYLTGA
jgi:hypothetical protein